MAEKCPKLHYLSLSSCSQLTDASLIALAQQCPLLTTLEVAGCTQFTDTAFQALARVSENFMQFMYQKWQTNDLSEKSVNFDDL